MAKPLSRSWFREMATVARYDYIKITFPDVHPVHRQHVDDAISVAVGRLREEYPKLQLHLPKATTLPPSPNKPDGKYIIELAGFVAEACKYLPAGWLEYVTYAHVKSFCELPPGWTLDDFGKVLTDRAGGYRNLSVRQYNRGNKTQTKQPGKAYTLGSGKSGCHLNAYRRPGQPVGIEGKFRDEQVKNVTLDALDWYEANKQNDQGAWDFARAAWGRRSAEVWSHELLNRGVEPYMLLAPTTYDEYAQGINAWSGQEFYEEYYSLPAQEEMKGVRE